MADPVESKVMPWWQIIGILVVVGMVSGLALGLLREVLGLSGGNAGVGVGAAIGVVGAVLIGRRSALLAKQNQKK